MRVRTVQQFDTNWRERETTRMQEQRLRRRALRV